MLFVAHSCVHAVRKTRGNQGLRELTSLRPVPVASNTAACVLPACAPRTAHRPCLCVSIRPDITRAPRPKYRGSVAARRRERCLSALTGRGKFVPPRARVCARDSARDRQRARGVRERGREREGGEGGEGREFLP